MRVLAIVIVSLIGGCGTAGAQGRTHLKVLSDIPESQLFLVMNAVAGSLGVTCEYCHVRNAPNPNTVEGGWIWDRDDKVAKAKGLEMIRMVRELNASRFGGRPVVTCYTCHQGSIIPARLSPLPPGRDANSPSGAAATSPTLPSVQAVWQKYLAAVGASQLDRFATTLLEGRDERSERRVGQVRVSFKGRDRYRLDLVGMRSVPITAQGLSGDTGWIVANGAARAVAPADVVRLRRQAARYAPVKIVDPPDALRITRIASVLGRDAYAAELTVDANTTRTYFFDTSTGLLVRELTTTATPLLPLQEQVDYENYRSVDGIMLPFVVRSSDDAPFDTSVRTFTRIAHDVAVDDATFAIPQAPQQPAPAQPPSPSAAQRTRASAAVK